MKTLAALFAASMLLATAVSAQTFLPQQPEPPGPVKIPDAPQLPYHFDTQITGANGEQFGNVSAVALRPNGNLLVFNRNPAIMMVDMIHWRKRLRSYKSQYRHEPACSRGPLWQYLGEQLP